MLIEKPPKLVLEHSLFWESYQTFIPILCSSFQFVHCSLSHINKSCQICDTSQPCIRGKKVALEPEKEFGSLESCVGLGCFHLPRAPYEPSPEFFILFQGAVKNLLFSWLSVQSVVGLLHCAQVCPDAGTGITWHTWLRGCWPVLCCSTEWSWQHISVWVTASFVSQMPPTHCWSCAAPSLVPGEQAGWWCSAGHELGAVQDFTSAAVAQPREEIQEAASPCSTHSLASCARLGLGPQGSTANTRERTGICFFCLAQD